jgi:hypothetical protein
MGTDDPTILLQALPEELQSFEVQAQPGELTARVAELRAAVDWLTARGLADSRLKTALRKAVGHG